MSDEDNIEDVTSAARALLAHYNRQLAEALARKILKNTNKTTWARFTKHVLGMIEEASRQMLWQEVCEVVRKFGQEYTRGDPYLTKMQEEVRRQADGHLYQAVLSEVRVLVQQRVQTFLKQYDTTQWLKDVPGKFKEIFESELRNEAKRLANEKATSLSVPS